MPGSRGGNVARGYDDNIWALSQNGKRQRHLKRQAESAKPKAPSQKSAKSKKRQVKKAPSR